MAVSKKKKKVTLKKKVTKKTLKKITVKKKTVGKKVAVKRKKVVKKIVKTLKLSKSLHNPIFKPTSYAWESQAVFNPAVVSSGGRIHLFYRALGNDGISRIGYASSKDGINFDDRLFYPVYFLKNAEEIKEHWPFTSPSRPIYDAMLYASGGGWGGCEDPRTVLMDGNVHMTFNVFSGWNSMRVAVISIKEEDLFNKKWIWKNFSYLSRLGDRQKNWVLFPEKINGKFAIFHNLDKGDPSQVGVAFVNKLDNSETPMGSGVGSEAPDPQILPDHVVAWHKRTRSAAAPPIKTKDGWLLLYHAMDKDDGNRYKLGALLLDLKDPRKVLYRAAHPILEPDAWYENDWKPGIIYASGAIMIKDKLFVYYGGGDKYIGVASIPLNDLIDSMKKNGSVKLEKNKILKFE
ncbi:MAG: hypothetical protein WC793_01305 [Candidatus Paceibacterota bacterium]|jgi:predicted GH43/DUF377 family glycosyl hydrolase